MHSYYLPSEADPGCKSGYKERGSAFDTNCRLNFSICCNNYLHCALPLKNVHFKGSKMNRIKIEACAAILPGKR